VVVDPLPRRRHRRFRPEVIQRLETLAHGTPADLLLETLDRRGPLPARAVCADTALPSETAAQALRQLLQEERVFVLPPMPAPAEDLLKSPASSSQTIASPAGWATLLSV